MRQAEFEQHVGPENISANITEALERARTLCAEIAAKAPTAEHWGRRKSDHEIAQETAAAAARD